MKKIISLSVFCVVYSVFWVAFAFSSSDTANADYLSTQGIIRQQTMDMRYRLDDKILRQEVIGTALKMKWIVLPENYTCKKYFTDAQNNDWVCRALEIAADNGIITRENAEARPADFVTKSEALAILLKSDKISLHIPRIILQADGSTWSLYQDLKKQGFTQWQADLLDSLPDCYLVNHGNSCQDGASTNKAFAQFQPNELAIRAGVFEYAALMMWFRALDNTGGVLDDFNVLVNTPSKTEEIDSHKLSSSVLKSLLLGEPIEKTSKTPEVILVVFSDFECPFCARYFQDVIWPLFQDTTQSLALVYKQFPLSFHVHAYDWALESECVNKNLWDIDFFKYIHERYVSPDVSVYTLAPKLTEEQMKACLTDTNLSQKITDDQNLGVQYKVSGTPTTLVINAKNGYYETVVWAQLKETVEATIKTVREHQ